MEDLNSFGWLTKRHVPWKRSLKLGQIQELILSEPIFFPLVPFDFFEFFVCGNLILKQTLFRLMPEEPIFLGCSIQNKLLKSWEIAWRISMKKTGCTSVILMVSVNLE